MPASTDVRVGLLAYSTNTGLGIQTLEFAEHLGPARVLLVDLSKLNHMPTHHERYAAWECVTTDGFPQVRDIERFLDGLDVVFVAETPLNYDLFALARERGVATVLQPNHEFNDYLQRPHLPLPDLFGLPSVWHYDDLPFANKRLLPVPVATERLPKHPGTGGIQRFLHIAGRPAVHDRNGTAEVIAAFRSLPRTEATLTVRVQVPEAAEAYRRLAGGDPRITIDATDVREYWSAYDGYDCLVLPRKYGGLCLPMQEALGSGIPVIMTAVSPNDAVLPPAWLVPATHSGTFQTRSTIDVYTVDVPALAAKLTALHDLGPTEARAVYAHARTLGDSLGWERLQPMYADLLTLIAGHGT